MAVYTHLAAEVLAELIAQYDVGELVSAKGIAEGVSNSNWLVETTGKVGKGARFILTMYERRIALTDLPFFLDLLDHLSAKGAPVPRTIHDREGASFRMLEGKAVALIEYLPGVSVDHPTPAQAHAVGIALARMHRAGLDYDQERANGLDLETTRAMMRQCGNSALAEINPALPDVVGRADILATTWPTQLPRSVIHSDLFPDNVLMLGDEVTGMIDFYFACNDAMAYDLAVTHAAWCFDRTGATFHHEVGSALLEGYQSVRPLELTEKESLSTLAQGACLRFVASRAEDWIDTPADAHVTRKDPMDFVRRWDFYAEQGDKAFA